MKLPALFNPSNDMALAANLRQYTPPRHIQQMEADLAGLSQFWDEGPWGWSLATKQRYLRMGISECELPSDEWLADLRCLSSREFGVSYYKTLSNLTLKGKGHSTSQESIIDEEGILLPCQARFVTSLSSLEILNLHSSLLILKAPWSSSGRGNMVIEDLAHNPDLSLMRRIEHIIKEQGGIVAEPFYADKTWDFAMEFQVTETGTEFLGYSVFFADETGHYGGNMVASQEQLLKKIDLPAAFLEGLIRYHKKALEKLPYRGPVGIDMMRLSDGRIHPCVEVNFRMTMGLLALLLYKKGIRDDQLLAGRTHQGFSAQIVDGLLSIACNK